MTDPAEIIPDLPETRAKNSILLTTKKMLGISAEYEAFDVDIITHINSVFAVLNQLDVGPKETFQITGPEELWSDFSTDRRLSSVRSYMYTKVRIVFDPPGNSFGITALEKQAAEFEWRLSVVTREEPPHV